MKYALLLALALPLQQSTPTGGNIAKLVPPVPTPASFISDARGVLSAADRAALDARIRTIQSAGLGDIAVAILPSVGGYSANQVAVEIYRTWKVGSVAAIGSAHRNVGVLILIVPKELAPDNRGQCWINTGTGAEGIITDATAGTICRDSIIPHLKNRDHAGAIGAGITAIELRLRGDADHASTPQAAADLPAEDDGRVPVVPFAIGGGLLALIFGAAGARRWRRNRVRACPRCGRPMRRLGEAADDTKLEAGARVEEKIGSVDYDVWVCDCGGSAVIPYRKWFSKFSECPTCHRRAASAKRKTIVPATTSSSGSAEDRFTCKACGAAWTVMIVLPELSTSRSSSSGGGGGSSGGGSSFGGSGSTSGGGGGGSY
jgi:uncharacterized protein